MAWPSVLPAGLAQAVHTAGASLSTSALSFLLPTCSSSGKAASGGFGEGPGLGGSTVRWLAAPAVGRQT